MKTLFFALLSISSVALAQTPAIPSTVVSERQVTLNVDISTARLKFSSSGYMAPVVKVLVPELADVTLLDHRNVGEGAPCLASYQALSPEEVIQEKPAVEKVEFQIKLTKIPVINEKENICEISLKEEINGQIRGFAFTHSRVQVIAKRSVADCR
jgi:hypothetical protein